MSIFDKSVMKKVVVASKNLVKVNAALSGFLQMFPNEEFEMIGISVESGVNDQPVGDEETMLGATNRANGARHQHPEADFWVGIEGGITNKDFGSEAFAWVIVESRAGAKGRGRTATFALPPRIMELIREGQELGDATDAVFKQHNAKQGGGSVGILTDGVIDRTKYYIHAVVLALIPIKNPELYPVQVASTAN
jgi:inosine/xanthosine triphosphatase